MILMVFFSHIVKKKNPKETEDSFKNQLEKVDTIRNNNRNRHATTDKIWSFKLQFFIY